MKTAAFFGTVLVLLSVTTSHAQTVKLKQTAFDDGTGSIGLAPGWQIQSAYRGAVTCTGPNSSAVILKVPWVIIRPESPAVQLPASQVQPIAPAGNLVAGLRAVLLKKAGATLKRVRGKRLGNVAPGTPAYLLMYEFTQNGKAMTGLGYFAPLDYGADQPFWQLYSSAVVAPTTQFAKLAPTMIAIWRSWRPNGEKPLEGSTSAIFDKILENRKATYEQMQKEFHDQL